MVCVALVCEKKETARDFRKLLSETLTGQIKAVYTVEARGEAVSYLGKGKGKGVVQPNEGFGASDIYRPVFDPHADVADPVELFALLEEDDALESYWEAIYENVVYAIDTDTHESDEITLVIFSGRAASFAAMMCDALVVLVPQKSQGNPFHVLFPEDDRLHAEVLAQRKFAPTLVIPIDHGEGLFDVAKEALLPEEEFLQKGYDFARAPFPSGEITTTDKMFKAMMCVSAAVGFLSKNTPLLLSPVVSKKARLVSETMHRPVVASKGPLLASKRAPPSSTSTSSSTVSPRGKGAFLSAKKGTARYMIAPGVDLGAALPSSSEEEEIEDETSSIGSFEVPSSSKRTSPTTTKSFSKSGIKRTVSVFKDAPPIGYDPKVPPKETYDLLMRIGRENPALWPRPVVSLTGETKLLTADYTSATVGVIAAYKPSTVMDFKSQFRIPLVGVFSSGPFFSLFEKDRAAYDYEIEELNNARFSAIAAMSRGRIVDHSAPLGETYPVHALKTMIVDWSPDSYITKRILETTRPEPFKAYKLRLDGREACWFVHVPYEGPDKYENDGIVWFRQMRVLLENLAHQVGAHQIMMDTGYRIPEEKLNARQAMSTRLCDYVVATVVFESPVSVRPYPKGSKGEKDLMRHGILAKQHYVTIGFINWTNEYKGTYGVESHNYETPALRVATLESDVRYRGFVNSRPFSRATHEGMVGNELSIIAKKKKPNVGGTIKRALRRS